MRRPFILSLLILASYCWLKDLVGLIYYICHLPAPGQHAVGKIVALSGVTLILTLLTRHIKRKTDTGVFRYIFQPERKKEWMILFLASLPILFLGLFRSIYPDECFDTFHFELYLQDYDMTETARHFAPGTLRTYYFPLAERMFGVFRHLFGYRMGAMFNTYLLITLLVVVYDFITRMLSLYKPICNYRRYVPALFSFLVVTADNTLFNIGSYKPDIIGVPFLVEMIYILLLEKDPRGTVDHLGYFLLGSLVACFKITYLPFVGTLLLVYYVKNFRVFPKAGRLSLPLVFFAAPSIYLLYNQLETYSPVFPFFNKFIRSPFYPATNFKDLRFGPRHFYENFIYPVVTLLDKQRCNDYGLYSYRLLLGYATGLVTTVICLIQWRKTRSLFWRTFFFIATLALLFDYFCIITTGYYRYAIVVEVLYGILLTLWTFYRPAKWVAPVILILIIFQTVDTINNIYITNRNLSWHDYQGLLRNRSLLNSNVSRLFHDYRAITDPDLTLPRVDAFLGMDPWSDDALARQLKAGVPIYDIQLNGRNPDSVIRFEEQVVRPLTRKKHVYVVAPIESIINKIIYSLNKRGYLATSLNEIYPSFMRYGEPLFLLEARYLDTNRYLIRYSEHYIKEENPIETRNQFHYHLQDTSIAFVREAPYVFDWDGFPSSYDLTVNDSLYKIPDRKKQTKKTLSFTLAPSELVLKKDNNIPLEVMIQEIQNKQPFVHTNYIQ